MGFLNKVMHVLAWLAVLVICNELADHYIDQKHQFDAGVWAVAIAMLVDTLLLKLDVKYLKKQLDAHRKKEIDELLKQVKKDFEKEWQNKHNPPNN